LAVGAAVCTLHVVHTIGVDDVIFTYLQSQAAGPAETMSQTLHRLLHLDPGGGGGSGPDGTTTVTFHILAGTGSAPWNTRETAVVGHVGDALHVVNDDTQAHQLHTPGTPFPHPSAAIPPGPVRRLRAPDRASGGRGVPAGVRPRTREPGRVLDHGAPDRLTDSGSFGVPAAARVGFEPTNGFPLVLFKSTALGHWATPPGAQR